MKYTNIRIASLKTIEECNKAIDLIDNDYRNIVGGFKAWNSGYSCDLLTGAQNKIDAINRKSNKLFERMIKELYKEYCKQNENPVSFEEYDEQEMYC